MPKDTPKDVLTINEAFAKKYGEEQSKLAFSRNEKKGARQSEYDRLRAEMEMENDEGDEGDSEEEDEEGQLLTPQIDRAINQTLAAIRRRDQDFLGKAAPMVAQQELGKTKRNAGTVKNVLAQQILEDEEDSVDEDNLPESSHVHQMKNKREFLKEAQKVDDESDAEDLFTVKEKTPEELEREQQETEEGQKALEAFFNRDKLSENDLFMKNFLQGWWKEKDLSKLPSYKEITGEDPAEHPDDSEDDAVLDAQDNFESKYNFRFQEEGAGEILSHPRQIEDSVRQTTSKRKRQREAKAEREKAEKLRREEELKRLKSLKKKEIQDKVNMLNIITGVGGKNLDASRLRLDRPFDPEEHDRMMREMFDNEYYDQEDDAMLDSEVRAEVIGGDDEDWDMKPGKFLRADVNKAKKYSKQQKKKNKKAAREDDATFGGDFGIEEADLDGDQRKEAEQLQQDLQTKLKELENLDYEDVIGGEVKCRFKYREAPAKDFGMTTEEILNATDKELNQMVSMKKLALFREDAKSNKPWWEMKGKRKTKAATAMREKRRAERANQTTTTTATTSSSSSSSSSSTANAKNKTPQQGKKGGATDVLPAPSVTPAGPSKANRRRSRKKKVQEAQKQGEQQ